MLFRIYSEPKIGLVPLPFDESLDLLPFGFFWISINLSELLVAGTYSKCGFSAVKSNCANRKCWIAVT